MKIVIELNEEVYDEILNGIENAEIAGVGLGDLSIALKNGTPLPKGHGRLIDADALKKESVMCPTVGNAETLLLDIWNVEHAPTIIEADKEGAE